MATADIAQPALMAVEGLVVTTGHRSHFVRDLEDHWLSFVSMKPLKRLAVKYFHTKRNHFSLTRPWAFWTVREVLVNDGCLFLGNQSVPTIVQWAGMLIESSMKSSWETQVKAVVLGGTSSDGRCGKPVSNGFCLLALQNRIRCAKDGTATHW